MVIPARRRGAELEGAIIDAVIEQLCEVGWNSLTMEGVAAGAHTGKAAVYRRWSNKADLVTDALEARLPALLEPTDTGSVRGDVLQLCKWMRDVMHSRSGQALRSVLHECDSSGAERFHELISNRLIRPSGAVFRMIVDRGIMRGDVRPDARGQYVEDVIPAMMMYRSKVCGSEWPDADIEDFTEQVLLPLLRA
ncbi:TetR/AcrR family transcriptional regulator [Streptomyces sp. NPDC089799]|uniref:TetR/AcrR family transcriptional regulator n=1 Tax=Streptomyces sp. NPDC089799 TaxID=3155066 RepID=UPI00343B11B4